MSIGNRHGGDFSLRPPNGSRRIIEGRDCVCYEGYWIRYYHPPEDSLPAKRRLIEHLSKRLFHHTELGINTPGPKLDEARAAYERETDPARKRVNGAMLAGALFNRATDIFTTVVDLEQRGVRISRNNELMRECESYFQEALTLGKSVKHYSGEEGIDELWGEPLKAFTMPIADFYRSRYLKIAQTMRDIDKLAEHIVALFTDEPGFADIDGAVLEFAQVAKLESEIMRSDPAIFEIWPRYVAAGEALLDFEPELGQAPGEQQRHRARASLDLLKEGVNMIGYLAGARVPMPKSTREYLKRCDAHLATRGARLAAAV
ncbi:MAG: hypothetical protein ACR2RL_22820 [Gammaproteobacteria bacterium]